MILSLPGTFCFGILLHLVVIFSASASKCPSRASIFPCNCNDSDPVGLEVKCSFCPGHCDFMEDIKPPRSFDLTRLSRVLKKFSGPIHSLSVSCANLSTIPAHYFSTFDITIKHLKITHSHILLIENKAFSSLENELTVLNLMHNQLKTTIFLRGLKKLQKLNLAFNKLKYLSFYVLLSMEESLKEINLRNNLLDQPSGFKRLKLLEKIDLSYNNISNIPETSFIGSEKILKEVNLQGNMLSNIGGFQNFQNLHILNLCHNQIKLAEEQSQLPESLNELHLCGNKIGAITWCTFKHLVNLSKLNMNDNNLFYIQPNAFLPLKKLKVLVLGYNSLSYIDDVFIGLPELQELHLYNNKIKVVRQDTFRGLYKLETLNLLYNHIHKIDTQSFIEMPNLKYLSLTGNYLEQISAGVFDGLSNLESLDLNDNHLQSLSRGVFKGLGILRQLSLTSNKLKVIQKGIFTLPSLEKIDLSRNMIKTFEEGSLDDVKNLHSLYLHSNSYENLDTKFFKNLPKLKELYLYSQQPPLIEPAHSCEIDENEH